MPHNMMRLYFRSPYFHISISALFSHSVLVLLLYIDLVLTLSVIHLIVVTDQQFQKKST